MKRFFAPIAFVSAIACAAPTQLPWNDAGSDAWRQELDSREKAAAILPLSPNVILGRARYGDAKNHVAVLLLDRSPASADDLLVARDADCTPRAILKPRAIDLRTRTVVCEVTYGEVRPDMEIVLPGSSLLKRSRDTLPSHLTGPEHKTGAPTTPAATKTSP